MEFYDNSQRKSKLDEIVALAKALGYGVETWSEGDNPERVYLQFSDAESGGTMQVTPDDDVLSATHKLLQFFYSCTEEARTNKLLDHELIAMNERCQKIDCQCSRNGSIITYQRNHSIYKLDNFAFSDWPHHYKRFFFKAGELRKLTEAICHDEQVYNEFFP